MKVAGALAMLMSLMVATAGCGSGSPVGAWDEDLDFLDVELRRRHADLFHSSSPERWVDGIDRLRTGLPTLTAVEAALELRRLVATVGDGHTRVAMDGLLTRYPIVLESVSDGVAVVAAAPAHAELVGAVVAEIAGLPAEEVIAAAEPFVSADNGVERRRRALGLVISPEFLRNAVGSDGPLTFRRDGVEVRRPLEAVPTTVWLTDVRGRPAAPYSWARRGDAIVVRYDLCADDPERPFAGFAAEVLAAAADPAVARLVVDLRRNPGGDSSVFEPLLEGLAGHPLDRPDRLFVLIGPRTYSSAVLNAAALDAATAATLVGEPTGGAVNGYGETRSFTLPKSGLVVEHSTRYFQVVEGSGDTLRPAVVIVPSSQDVAAGRDPALEWVLGGGA